MWVVFEDVAYLIFRRVLDFNGKVLTLGLGLNHLTPFIDQFFVVVRTPKDWWALLPIVLESVLHGWHVDDNCLCLVGLSAPIPLYHDDGVSA